MNEILLHFLITIRIFKIIKLLPQTNIKQMKNIIRFSGLVCRSSRSTSSNKKVAIFQVIYEFRLYIIHTVNLMRTRRWYEPLCSVFIYLVLSLYQLRHIVKCRKSGTKFFTGSSICLSIINNIHRNK